VTGPLAAWGASLARWLEPWGVDAFEHPGRLPWIALVLAVLAWWTARRPRAALAWPGLPEAERAGARRREPVPVLATGLRALALACLGAVLVGPVSEHRTPPRPGLGLDLVLVLDTSGSMNALDTSVAGRPRTRLDLAREVVDRFARDRVAEGDRVALVVFGEDAFTQCPLTSDGELLSAALERVAVGMAGEATALGDALALAVERAGRETGGAGRVVVLLTDGRSNAGAVPLDVAAELAAGEGVRVHTVGIGVGGERVPMAARPGRPRGGLRYERHDPDLGSLRRIAEVTGGRAFHARGSGDLPEVYAAIDALERVPRPLPPRLEQTGRPEPLLALAGGALLLEIALARVLRRRLP